MPALGKQEVDIPSEINNNAEADDPGECLDDCRAFTANNLDGVSVIGAKRSESDSHKGTPISAQTSDYYSSGGEETGAAFNEPPLPIVPRVVPRPPAPRKLVHQCSFHPADILANTVANVALQPKDTPVKVFQMTEPDPAKPTSRVYKVVLTGGPCGGKTTGQNNKMRLQDRLASFFESMGWKVFTVPEAATVLLNGGVKFAELNHQQAYQFQKNLLLTLIQIEQVFFNQAALVKDKNVLIICAMDPSAYMPTEEWERLLKECGKEQFDLREERYHQIIHMVMDAEGAEKYYTVSNNTARSEGLKQAKDQDNKTRSVWVGHPYVDVILGMQDTFMLISSRLPSHANSLLMQMGQFLSHDITRNTLISTCMCDTRGPQRANMTVSRLDTNSATDLARMNRHWNPDRTYPETHLCSTGTDLLPEKEEKSRLDAGLNRFLPSLTKQPLSIVDRDRIDKEVARRIHALSPLVFSPDQRPLATTGFIHETMDRRRHPKPPVRGRKLTERQYSVLLRLFEVNPYPSKAEQEIAAQHIGVHQHIVLNWFNNRRAEARARIGLVGRDARLTPAKADPTYNAALVADGLPQPREANPAAPSPDGNEASLAPPPPALDLAEPLPAQDAHELQQPVHDEARARRSGAPSPEALPAPVPAGPQPAAPEADRGANEAVAMVEQCFPARAQALTQQYFPYIPATAPTPAQQHVPAPTLSQQCPVAPAPDPAAGLHLLQEAAKLIKAEPTSSSQTGLPSNKTIRKLAKDVGVFRIGGAAAYDFTRFLTKKLVQKLMLEGRAHAKAQNRVTVTKDDLLAVLEPYRV